MNPLKNTIQNSKMYGNTTSNDCQVIDSKSTKLKMLTYNCVCVFLDFKLTKFQNM